MSSHSASGPRRVPKQARGRLRVEKLLAAAEAELAAAGYPSATMCAIAERAQTAIGSLYQFYPNKEAVAEALRARYTANLSPRWRSLTRAARAQSGAAIAAALVGLMREASRDFPAYAALVDAPPTVGSPQRRGLFRRRIAAVLRARRPSLSPAAALRAAAVVQQLLRGLLTAAPLHSGEFQQVLSLYLTQALESRNRPRPNNSTDPPRVGRPAGRPAAAPGKSRSSAAGRRALPRRPAPKP